MVSKKGLTLQNITFRIGDFHLENQSMEIHKSEYFVLTGNNGAGKSVLIKLMAGIYQPIEGSILIEGQDVAQVPPWQRNIGYVPQDGILFPDRTVRKNIAFGLEIRKMKHDMIGAAVNRIAQQLEIEYLLERMPEGLSGGEKQKTAIARALVIEPDILLLDEPVSSLDEKARNTICKDLKKLQQDLKITTVHVSHNTKETEMVADRVGMVSEGYLIIKDEK
jgi:molybdate/tungstate transport system ATP-binding protein